MVEGLELFGSQVGRVADDAVARQRSGACRDRQSGRLCELAGQKHELFERHRASCYDSARIMAGLRRSKVKSCNKMLSSVCCLPLDDCVV